MNLFGASNKNLVPCLLQVIAKKSANKIFAPCFERSQIPRKLLEKTLSIRLCIISNINTRNTDTALGKEYKAPSFSSRKADAA